MNLTDYESVRTLLNRHNFRFSKSLGQNFLISSWVPERISDSSGLDGKTGVVEIGPGIGCLTKLLSQKAAKVISIEFDKTLMPVLSETLAGCENTEVIFKDALKVDYKKLVSEELDGLKPVLCANLPYSITTPLLRLVIESECFDSVTVMIQKEVAKRICAGAGDKDYCSFGIFVQWNMKTEMLFDVPPSCFVPQPKVTSSVIRLIKREEKPVNVGDEKLMFSIIRSAFNMRRKTFVNAVTSGFPGISREMLESLLTESGFDTKIRGESLSVSDYAKISDKIGLLMSNDL